MRILLALAAVALALGAAGGTETPCRADFARLCPGLPPGEAVFGDCVRRHLAEVSPECRAKLEAAKAARRENGRLGPRQLGACRTDVERHCAGVRSGGGRLRRCLEGRGAELSAGCRGALRDAAAR
jgi:hypothetical protein